MSDQLFYMIAFYSYLAGFLAYILHIALRKQLFGIAGTVLLAIGAVPHTIAFFIRWAAKGHVPLANMYEYMGIMSWMVVVGMLYFVYRYKNHKLGVFVAPIAIMLLVVASLLPSDINVQLMPALQSTWLAIHVSLAALGSGAFLIAFSASTLYLFMPEMENNRKNPSDMPRFFAQFGIFWFLVPVVFSVILKAMNILPTPYNMATERMIASGSAVTAFALGNGPNAAYMGQSAIGLGIGMVIASVLWPVLHGVLTRNRKKNDRRNSEDGFTSKAFMAVVFGLLLAAVLVGFMIKGNSIQVTSRSYFKIFEFFGPVLVLSWIIIPIIYLLFTGKPASWMSRLNISKSVMEDISYSAVAIGYPLYTIGALFAGAIWAEQAWGTWWSWDPKEVGALVIWLFYTGFLHARYQRGWSGNRAQMMVVLGMVFVFISFFGNYFFGGLHSFEVT